MIGRPIAWVSERVSERSAAGPNSIHQRTLVSVARYIRRDGLKENGNVYD
jgi:hypothetical protein